MSCDVRKSGIPVLAYTNCDAAPTLSCMIFRFNEAQATATILVQCSLPVDGHDQPQPCTMQYDSECLQLGRLGPATLWLAQDQLNGLAREGSPQMQTLTLTLHRPPVVWAPLQPLKWRPQPGHEAVFEQVAVLARATTLHVMLDMKWLHRDHQAVLRRLLAHPDQLRAFPVWRHYTTRYRRADWRLFGDSFGDELHPQTSQPLAQIGELHAQDGQLHPLSGELPPQYAESSKRPRNATPTRTSPPHKRLLLSPGQPPPSPTEKNTPSPRAPSISTPSPTNLLPLETAISSLLPDILSSLLPSLLPHLLTLQSPSPAPSLLDAPSQRGTPPPSLPTTLSALGVSLSEHVTRRIEFDLSTIYSHTLSHANFLRNEADAAFFEDREGERLAWQREVEDVVEDFKEQLSDVAVEERERVEGEMEQKATDFSHRLGDAVEQAVARVDDAVARIQDLKSEKDLLKSAVRQLKHDRRDLKAEKKDLQRDIKHLRCRKSCLRHDVRDLRRRKAEMQGQTRSPSVSTTVHAVSVVDSQDLDR